jgi:hypothetical protein
MSHSEVGICNIALAALGAEAIRTFDEDNKRARMCKVFYDIARDLMLSKFDWPFARKYAQLQQLDTTGLTIPTNMYVYQIPSDCKTPRTIQDLGSRDLWRVVADTIHCYISSGVYLYYTKHETNPAMFTDTFVDMVYLHLAVQMGPALTTDKKLVSLLREQYKMAQFDGWESDANIGNDYISHDDNPENDTFVNVDGKVVYVDPDSRRYWE